MIETAHISETSKADYRLALQKFETLHGNMAVLSRIGTLLRDVNTGPEDIAKLLQTDGALSASIIRMSNSALYGRGSKTGNVHDALIKVGYNQILSLLGATLSKQVFMKDLPAYSLTADDYWTYSYFCSVFLEAQAIRLGRASDEGYMVGLLHSIGRVVINELLVKTELEICWDPSIPCEEWEQIILGFSHEQAGSTLLKNWKFTPEIYIRVAEQKSPAAQGADPLLLILDFARVCVENNHYQINRPGWSIPKDHPYNSSPDFDLTAITAQIEQARALCVKTKEALNAT